MGFHSCQQFHVLSVNLRWFMEAKRRISSLADYSLNVHCYCLHLSLDSMHDIGSHQNGHTKSILDKNTTVQRDKFNIARFLTLRTLGVLSAQADAKPKFRQIDECLNAE